MLLHTLSGSPVATSKTELLLSSVMRHLYVALIRGEIRSLPLSSRDSG